MLNLRQPDFTTVEEIQGLYWQIQKSATLTALLLPWFPGLAKNEWMALFTKLHNYIELTKKRAALPSSDSIDV